MKPATFEQYPPDSLELSEKGLLTAWDRLPAYHSDLVLVGGLGVHYLTNQPEPGMKGAVTMDVDLAINIAASGGQYGSIATALSSKRVG